MWKAGLWGLLWTFLVSEARAAVDPAEERYELLEGQTLTVSCPFNIMKHASSQKAWQRLPDGKEPLTLVVTEKSSTNPSEVRVGKYTLKDDPAEAMLHVQMRDLRVTDSGLYRCVIYYPSKEPVLLFHPVRLVVTKDSSGLPTLSVTATTRSTKAPILITTKHPRRDRTVTQPFPKSTAVVSSPDPGVTFPNVITITRVSILSIVVPMVCGLFIKTLVFTVLFAVTRRSFG
ncbi:triggering receptor expressed on myeloid cells 1 [Onychomys torridus]|uniref:triggering receptor expressed on myeloid cells 1 n=1 Tax=Onychomys torridus TaxID=38674 RepID=UPI00167FD2DB|nr:triggering receptor expressed on myeloid cells 1 [Onychomys torridus]